ncbi:Chorismate mutase I / Prephenate dehydratase [hydrothermal vent metagenome]|uniref:Bifunctional chorismate mutase/prephenate dehydratase n=1 Tax=hydrothermal vent metagenome TaxID=652676 RepID=A0A1W1CAX7_9ZZZZ
MAKTLEELRNNIDELDAKIQKLITNRALLAQEVAEVKKKTGSTVAFYRPEREAQVLRKIKERNEGVLPDNNMAHIFREIMSACLALEQKLKVAYLGPEGTFTQEASFKHFGNAVSGVDCPTIDKIFIEVDKGNANYGVVPIENSTNGVIGATIDMLWTTNLEICGEVEIEVHHQLMSQDINQEIKVIYAHQQAFDQSRRWLENHYPNAELKAVASNALAARMAKDEKNTAAIASQYALSLYGLERIAKNIEDNIGNTTRFLVLGKESIGKSDKDKTSILVTTKHQAGALFDLLEPFKQLEINIFQLARHPISGIKWEYLFLVDFAGHKEDTQVIKALNLVEKKVSKLKVLGSYPVCVL